MDSRLLSSKLVSIAICGLAAWISGCSPLTNALFGSGCGGLGVTSDGGASTQQKVYSSQDVAQSFLVAGSSVTLSSIQLNLQAVGVTTPTTTLIGTLTVTIESDSVASTTTTPTPTTPSGSAQGSGTLDVSTISSNAPTFYTITFATPVTLSSPAIYWVHANYGAGSSAQYVGWDAASGTLISGQIAAILASGGSWTPVSGITMDVLGGC